MIYSWLVLPQIYDMKTRLLYKLIRCFSMYCVCKVDSCVPVSADCEQYPIIILEYVSRLAAARGKDLLIRLGVKQARIDDAYINERNTTDAVQSCLEEWAGMTDPAPTWRDLLDAMNFAKYTIKEREALKKRIQSIQSQGDSVYELLDCFKYTLVTTHAHVCTCVCMIPLDGHYSRQLFVY